VHFRGGLDEIWIGLGGNLIIIAIGVAYGWGYEQGVKGSFGFCGLL
jgi:hypothetical protein